MCIILDMQPPEYVEKGTSSVVRAADAELLAGGSIGLLAQTSTVASSRAVLRAGSPGVPPHFHAHSSEVFLVIAGALEALVGEEIITLAEGDVLIVEPPTVHALTPAGGADAAMFVITTPPCDRFAYYRLLDRIQRGDAEPESLTAAQDRFDSHFVDSLVWSSRPHAAQDV